MPPSYKKRQYGFTPSRNSSLVRMRVVRILVSEIPKRLDRKVMRAGFTLIELIVAMGLIAILLSLTTINLIGAQRKATLSSTVTTLISDLKEQQTKAMTGATEGQSQAYSYGVYFEADKYTLFRGSSYSSADPSNFVVNVENIQFSNPLSSIVFAKISGEIASDTSITLTDTTNNQQKTIQINKYGVVTDIN